MSFRLSTVRTLFACEVRMLRRDRRTIITAIMLPLIVMPLVLFGSSWTRKKREQTLAKTVYHYAITGSRSEWLRSLLAQARERAASVKTNAADPFRFEEIAVTNVTTALSEAKIHFFLEALAPGEARNAAVTNAAAGNPALKRAGVGGTTNRLPLVGIVFRGDRDDSSAGMSRMQKLLRESSRVQRVQLLAAHELRVAPEEIAPVSEINLASKGQTAGLGLGKVLTLFVLFFIFGGGAVVANDLIAGEKERGTLETLLTTGAGRTEIIVAKHLVILAVAIIITLIQSCNLLVYVGLKLVPASSNLAAAVPPGVAVLLLVLFLPIAALAAGMLLLTSGYAKSYKEAQLYFLPVVLVSILPALAPLLPNLPLRSAIVLVPIANLAVAIRDILVGSRDWLMISVSWLVTCSVAVWTTRIAVRFLSAERLIAATENDAVELAGGAALFERHVWRWYAVLWALLWMVNGYFAKTDLRMQIVINLVVLLFGASLLMIRSYRLPAKAVLAWRLPRPAVWFAVLWAIPSGLLTAAGVTRLADLFFPVSSEMMDEFTRSLFPPGLSTGQMLFFVAIMPGFFEEIAFRGVLLHGLHRRLNPLTLSVAVGVVFGIFHFALFRLLPTAFLGALFAAVTLLTGSIFPAMLWHAGNNALGMLAASEQVPLSELDPLLYVGGAAMLAAAFWVFWRNRTPYPGMRR